MSYDVYIVKFAERYDRVSDMPDDSETLVLGTEGEVRGAVDRLFAGVQWGADGWGVWDGASGSIEFHLRDDLTCLALHIRASDDVMPGVAALCRDNHWRGMDGADDDFIEDRETPAASLAAWRSYRDSVI